MEYIINNKDIQISQTENSFNLQYRIINKQMYLDKLINFQFLNIIYELNKSLFDDFKIQIISEDKATIYILFKWLFKDFDIKQCAVVLNINRTALKENQICFECTSISDANLFYTIPEHIKILNIDNLTINFDISDKHNIHINNTIIFQKKPNILPYIQKMTAQIISKMIINTKQFIEKMI
jgi:hypothetical protein